MRHPHASVFHTPTWLRALRLTYGYDSVVYTTTPPGTDLTNGLVACRVYSGITGRRLVSLPFSDHCDPLIESEEDLDPLIHALEADRVTEDCQYFEVRPRTPLALAPRGLEPSETFCFHSVDLTPVISDIFGRLHKDSTQRKIRRAERERLTYEQGRGEGLLDTFYQLLIRTRRRQHLPPPPRTWFRNLVDGLGDDISLRIASKAGQPIASIVTLRFKDVLVYKYGCSDERFHNLGGMQLLLWKAIQEAKHDGARELDLGRSDRGNSGLITFKDRWGSARSDLTYWKYPADGPATAAFPNAGSLLIRACRTRFVERLSAHLPDRLLVAVGSLFYKHIG